MVDHSELEGRRTWFWYLPLLSRRLQLDHDRVQRIPDPVEMSSATLSLRYIQGWVDDQHVFASVLRKGSELGIRFEFQLESGKGRRVLKLRLILLLRL